MGLLRPSSPKSNKAKRGKGGSPPAAKVRWVPHHKWAHLSQFWPLILSIPKWQKRTPGPKLDKNHTLATFNPWPLASPETTSSSPPRPSLNSGEDISFTKGSRSGAPF
ncbi:hypothetical protein O181_001848 [Austropuccinia psidii MF-1]|uniref:Uncharacterized protein n=1 Tax=Austropuccinia psidii MF-1 TaxID=1389203 RepID=A0A9Q3BBM2_9BASI|nr:hypothetical protein [Austropuccinia psidii MF-1]